jgi:mutator protein MutT
MTIKYTRWLRSYVGPQRLLQVRTSGYILNEAKQILLCRRADVMMWDVPGGAVELGETPAEALVREVAEETGLQVHPTKLLGVYAGPGWEWTYPNGDQVEIINIFFACDIAEGSLGKAHSELLKIEFFPLDKLPALLPRTARMLNNVREGKEGHFD